MNIKENIDSRNNGHEPIAIIGMGCRFPGANSPKKFWKLLKDGVDVIKDIPKKRYETNPYDASSFVQKGDQELKKGGFLEDISAFDADFFGYTEEEAKQLDPQERLLLEVTWEALEDASIVPASIKNSKASVFLGIGSNEYTQIPLSNSTTDEYDAAYRLARQFELKGSSATVNTRESSSLAALHQAVMNLRNGESTLALAGAVNLIMAPFASRDLSDLNFVTIDGKCKSFDERANGYVRSEGCGVVVLKRLSDALKDGDHILAVIRGIAFNQQENRENDSQSPAYSDVQSQIKTIKQALENASVEPEQISFFEADGSGIHAGDALEIQALNSTISGNRKTEQKCAVGFTKTNIGHMELAAGMASLIKVVFTLRWKKIPGNLYFEKLNSKSELNAELFSIPKKMIDWPAVPGMHFAALHSLGLDGTQGCAILEAPPVLPTSAEFKPERPQHMLVLSASNEEALKNLALTYESFLGKTSAKIGDIVTCAATGRSQFEHRMAIVADSPRNLKAKLKLFNDSGNNFISNSGITTGKNAKKIFLFSGAGCHYEGMGLELYQTQPFFQNQMQECDAILKPLLGEPLEKIIFSEYGPEDLLTNILYMQPAIFALEFSLAKLWMSWGIMPDVVLGHNIGEYVAACIAGVLTLEEGLNLVVEHARITQEIPLQGVTSIVIGEAEIVQEAINGYADRVSITGYYGPRHLQLAGEQNAMESVTAKLKKVGITARPAMPSRALNSPLMSSYMNKFVTYAEKIKYASPQIPFLSTVTGEYKTDSFDAAYWTSKFKEAEKLHQAFLSLSKEMNQIFIDCSPSPKLTSIARFSLPSDKRGSWLASMETERSNWDTIMDSLSSLYLLGNTIDWKSVESDYERVYATLPTYQFTRKNYWLDKPVNEEEIHTQPLAKVDESEAGKTEKGISEALPSKGDYKSYPLTHNQQALFLIYSLAPENYAYNIAFATRIIAVLNVSILELSFSEILKRHSIMRSTYHLENDQPIMRIYDEMDVKIDVIDVSGKKETDIRADIKKAGQVPYNLEKGPTFRVKLYRISEKEHIFLLGMHHIMTDGSSLIVLIDELFKLYTEKETKGTFSLLPPEKQYTDFLEWQTNYLKGQDGVRHWQYWSQKLTGKLPPLNLPLDNTRPSVQTFNGTGIAFKIDKILADKLKRLASEKKTSLYMLMLALFQVMLYRYTGQKDLLIGSPVSGRSNREFSNVLGYCANMVVLREELNGKQLFSDFLNQVRKTCMEALEHHIMPFPLLVEKLRPDRDPSRSPLFDILFALENETIDSLGLLRLFSDDKGEAFLDISDSVRLESFTQSIQDGQFDIELQMFDGENGIVGTLKYNQDLFQEATIQRMIQHYITLAESIVEEPDSYIANLRMIPDEELETLCRTWNDTSTDYPQNTCVHKQFESQVQKTPNAKALISEKGSLTYQELNTRANQLAHHLIESGLKPGMQVGICMERCLEIMVAIFAIIKAGGTYIPMNASYPGTRLASMIEEMEATTIITLERFLSRLPEQGLNLICLDLDTNAFENQSPNNPEVDIYNEQLLYAIFTSGSTGAPKMAGVHQTDFVNLVHWYIKELGITDAEKTLLMTPVSFDQAQKNLFAPLIKGAELHIQEGFYDSRAIKLQIEKYKITHTNCTPSAFYPLIEEEGHPDDLNSLRCVIFGGEPISAARLQKWTQSDNYDTSIFNTYGPTECTDTTSFHKLTPDDLSRESSIPIGKPTDNTGMLILDRHKNILPIGAVGELHIFGTCVGRGYLNSTPKTVEAFIPGLEEAIPPSKRMYRTGDLARYWPDGNVEFLGRLDHQVKIRGFRIELGDIETSIRDYQGVRDVVILAHDFGQDEKRLIAYLISDLVMDVNSMDDPLYAHEKQDHRRTELRIPIFSQCLIKLDDGSSRRVVAEDLSTHGISFLKVPVGFLKEEQEVKVVFETLGIFRNYVIYGKVTWTRDDRAALIFDTSPAERERFSVIRDNLMQTKDFMIFDQRATNFRLQVQLKCKLKLEGLPLIELTSEDLSIKGVALSGVPAECYKHQALQIDIYLPEIEEELSLSGSVIWVRNGRAGIGFEESKVNEDKIRIYLQKEAEKSGLTIDQLRKHLKDKLPDYMVPSYFVMLDSLPLTPNGKVDRKQLPGPDTLRKDIEGTYVEPQTEVEKAVAKIWEETLGIERVGLNDNFFESGGHSIIMARVISQVRGLYDIDIPLSELFTRPVLKDFVSIISEVREKGAEAVPELDVTQDIILSKKFKVENLEDYKFTQPENIFLTGGTGYAGAFLIDELINQSNAKLYCLVRAGNQEKGLTRIIDNMKKYLLWKDEYKARITALPGDIAEPLLGLEEEKYQWLAMNIDTILHNGAMVSYWKTYTAHKAANIEGTSELLNLACKYRLKAFHYVSTLSVFDTLGYTSDVVVNEESPLLYPEEFYMGYSQSKFIGESIVNLAKKKGLPVTIHRPGRISGHSETGLCNLDDFYCRELKGCIQVGFFPEHERTDYYTPVDYFSKSLVTLMLKEESVGQIYHFFCPETIRFTDQVDWFRSYGYNIPLTSLDNWAKKMYESSDGNEFETFIPLLTEKLTWRKWRIYEILKTRPQIQCMKTVKILDKYSVQCPSIEAILQSTMDYYIKSKFLEEPK